MSTEALGGFLREVSNWNWEQFCRAEHDLEYTSNEAMIFGLLRSCAMQKMDAIRMSLNRLDGKLKTPIRVEYPKVYYLYPNATLENYTEAPKSIQAGAEPIQTGEIIEPETPVEEEVDLDSLSLRDTLTKMSGYARQLPEAIVQRALEVEIAIRGQGPMPDDIPRVKSVVSAHLLILAQKRDISALSEVFDQIDGKLVETLQILGQDIFITSYAAVAPPGAYPNKDGVMQMEATVVQDMWANKLGREASSK